MRSTRLIPFAIVAAAVSNLCSIASAMQCPAGDYLTGESCSQRTLAAIFKGCDDRANECTVTKPAPENGNLKHQPLKLTPPKPSSLLAHNKLGATQPDFDKYVTIYQELVLALRKFEEAYPPPKSFQSHDLTALQPEAQTLARYFEASMVAIDVTGITDAARFAGPVLNGLPEQNALLIFGQLIANGYATFGCPAPDAPETKSGSESSTAPRSIGAQGAAVAVLAFQGLPKDSGIYQAKDALIIRMWIDTAVTLNSNRIRRIKISSESNALNNALSYNSYRCSKDITVTPLPAPQIAGQPPSREVQQEF